MEIAQRAIYLYNFNPVINEVYVNGSTQRDLYRYRKIEISFSDNKIVQNNEGGFTGKNIEIKTFYNDPADESNYYLYKYSDSSKPIIRR
jgi:hypothetical protein